MKITFFGAAQDVTGSKHLVETNGFRLLLDCGMHQGKRADANRLNRELPFSAASINAVILSHGHLDHCGSLPMLVKNGFAGSIYCTSATADIAASIMADAAAIQEQDAAYFNQRLPKNEKPIEVLYTIDDVKATVPHFVGLPYFRVSHEWVSLNANIRFKLLDAGHILGSAITVIEITETTGTNVIAFSGDLGQKNTPILFSPEPITELLDAFLLECTYGGKNHKPLDKAIGELADIIQLASREKRKIIVPAFSLGRTQELIYLLHKLTDEKKIPALPIYIDSPLAVTLTEIFSKHAEDFDAQTWQDFSQSDPPFAFSNLHYTRSVEESKGLNELSGPLMIIAGSGMAEGGRILHHLKNNISDPNAIILITGYQAEQTLGWKIQNGNSPVKIFGELYDVRAQIQTFDEFSAHADQAGLLEYLASIPAPKAVCLVHGEMKQALIFQHIVEQRFPHVPVTVPAVGQTLQL